MDVRALKHFIAVYEHKSISAAATATHISQPSLSSAIKSLEQELNCQLFERHPKGVSVTSDAERLYPMAIQITGQIGAIQQAFKPKAAIEKFRLGLTVALGARRMTRLLKNLVEQTRGVELILVEDIEGCDAKIVAETASEPGSKFQPLWCDEFVLALPHAHPLSLKKEIKVEDLDGLNFIYRSPCEQTRQLMNHMEQVGASFNICARIRTVEYAVGLVAAGVGAALIPNDKSFFPGLELFLRPIAGVSLFRTVGLSVPQSRLKNSTVKRLLDIGREQWQQLPAHKKQRFAYVENVV